MFFLCKHPLLILFSSLCLVSNTISLFFFLDSMFVYVCLNLDLSISTYLFLLLSTFIFIYLLLPLSNVCLCLMFAPSFFCLPLFGFCSCLLVFAYVCFYLVLLIYLLLNSKLCELLSSKFCLFSKFFSFSIHYLSKVWSLSIFIWFNWFSFDSLILY
jgi:hypothetical protein